MRGIPFTLLAFLSSASLSLATACNSSALNTTTSTYEITKEKTTVFDVARATKRGACDIARLNMMADVTILPNVGETFNIPGESCHPDNDSCILKGTGRTRTCIYGGPRLYYTVNGDTYEKIAIRLNITTESLTSGSTKHGGSSSPNETLPTGQFVKAPLCSPSQCVIQPYTFKYGVYKDLAEKYGTTVGQIMMLSPTYNYSNHDSSSTDSSYPSIDLPINCTALSNNVTVIS